MSPYLTTTIALVRSKEPDLTQRQTAILGLVVETPALTTYGVKNLAELLGIHRPAITTSTDRLIAMGLVLRRPVPVDRRLIRIVATPAGRAFWKRVSDERRAAA